MPTLNATDPLPQLAPLGQPVGDNLGGVQEVYLLPQAALRRNPVRAGGSVVGNLLLVPGAVWYPVRAVLNTAAFDQAFTRDRQQGLYESQLTGEVAEDTPDLAAALLRYRNVRLLVLYRDGNGRLKLAGDRDSWYQLSYRQQTQGSVATGRAGYVLEFAGRSLRPALFYVGTFEVAGVGAGPQDGAPADDTGGVQVFNSRGRLLATAQAGQRVILTSAFRVTVRVTS